MEIKIINQDFSICKIESMMNIKTKDEFFFFSKTDEENSLVCLSESVPPDAIKIDSGWRAFRIEGVLDFSLIGILSKITTILAENKVGIFAVSTYNTDYILTKATEFEKAINALKYAGYTIVN